MLFSIVLSSLMHSYSFGCCTCVCSLCDPCRRISTQPSIRPHSDLSYNVSYQKISCRFPGCSNFPPGNVHVRAVRIVVKITVSCTQLTTIASSGYHCMFVYVLLMLVLRLSPVLVSHVSSCAIHLVLHLLSLQMLRSPLGYCHRRDGDSSGHSSPDNIACLYPCIILFPQVVGN